MTVSIAFLGDTLLGGNAEKTLEREGYAYVFEGIAPYLSEADLVVANHEGPITAMEKRSDKGYNEGKKRRWYRARPESADALAEHGINVVSLANNHALDYGLKGLSDTIRHLDDAGIAHCGAALDIRDAFKPVVATVGKLRIAFFSYMQRYDVYTREDVYATDEHGGVALLPEDIRVQLDAVADVDLRVVLVHWGRTYRQITPRQEKLAARFREAGVDLVIGHHSHTAHGVDLSEKCPVLFSLGNGAFGTSGRFAKKDCPPYGLLATVEIDEERAAISGAEVRLLYVDNRKLDYRPVQATEAGEFLRSLVVPDHGWYEVEAGTLRVNLTASDPT